MVFGLFSKDRALQRTIDKATSKLAQHQDRWAAMEKLRDNGTDDALHALCKRFSFHYDKTSEDEQEKAWVVDALVAKGEMALGPLRRYMAQSTTIAHPLMVLERIANKAKALEVVDELLANEEPGYTRDPEKRQQIIDWLGEWAAATDDEVAERVIPYLADFDENVRFATVQTLSNRPSQMGHPALVAALVRADEDSKRLRIRIAEVLAEQEAPLGEHKAAVSELLGDTLSGFQMKHDKLRQR